MTVSRTFASSTAGSAATRALTINSAAVTLLRDGRDSSGAGGVAHQVRDAERKIVHADRFEVGSFQALAIKGITQMSHHVQQQIVDGEGLLRLELYAGVEPAHFGFAFGVDVVIDIQNLPAECPVLIQQFDEGFKALPCLGGRGQQRGSGVTLADQRSCVSATSAGLSSSMRLRTMASASSSCLWKMYAAWEKSRNLARLRKIRRP